MNTEHKGGKIIASGGFGCIFKPALKCETHDSKEPHKISKLMTSKNAKEEYNKITQFQHILQVIPNYSRHFLLEDFILCKPVKLTTDDLTGYNKKCKALNKKGITFKNINNSLDKVLSINMPDGGIDVEMFIDDYVDNNSTDKHSTNTITILNNSLIDLLVHGIVPMNNLNVYHCDIKDTNVLVNPTEKGLPCRLIDWGLSIIHTKNGIPRTLYRRPFQYNVPFSSILFNKDFLTTYYRFLAVYPNPIYFQIREFIVNYIFVWNEIRGPGHLSAINDIVKKLTIKELISVKNKKVKDHLIEYDFTYYYIIEYLSTILNKYTKNGNLDLMTYFNTIFLKNIDIWGFVMIYMSLYNSFLETLNDYQMQFISKIKYIVIHFLYESPINEINVSSLVNELTNLNSLIEKFSIIHDSKKLDYFLEINPIENGGTKLKRNITKKHKLTNYKNKSNNKSKSKTIKARKQ